MSVLFSLHQQVLVNKRELIWEKAFCNMVDVIMWYVCMSMDHVVLNKSVGTKAHEWGKEEKEEE